ncbi:MAG: transcriptional regulator, partial [Clostridia bacterium]|nr:transcriptional regulator [Clostridia bacterium]
KGYIERVRQDLYAVISLETKQPVLNQYQIGCSIFPDAHLTHHSAFEYYGYANQVYNEIYIATDSRFKDFEYNGFYYHRVAAKQFYETVNQNKIKVTSLEQTVIDSIEDFEKLTGLEEVLRCLEMIPSLNEQSLMKILNSRGNMFLWQKCGYILESMNTELGLSVEFFDECRKHISKAKHTLVRNSQNNILNKRWNLYISQPLSEITGKGVDINDF